MMEPKSRLTVLHDDNGAFTNYTDKAADLTRDDFTIAALDSAQDYLYVGFEKPFGAAYFHFTTANASAGSLSAEVYIDGSWTSLVLQDETQGFTRSGFIFWDKAGMSSVAVNSVSKFYIRFRPSVTNSSTVYRGINLIFADDAALKEEFFEITNANMLPAGENSFVTTHVAVRNYILSHLRNHYLKLNSEDGLKKIIQYDLIDIFEIREAAVFLALSKIFFNLSDSPDDHWWVKYREYQDKYEAKMTLARLSIDENDDGIDDESEKLEQFKPTRWAR
jgi:hypothetical protein